MIEYLYNPEREKLQDIVFLFREYADRLNLDLCFQNFEEELKTLPGKYSPPEGCLILARKNNDPAGCIALRKIEGNSICEMKRLYVREKFRGCGIGKDLVSRIIAEAVRLGYGKMVLDTLDSMKSARSLYRAAGFSECEPYYHNPLEGAVFMELVLPQT